MIREPFTHLCTCSVPESLFDNPPFAEWSDIDNVDRHDFALSRNEIQKKDFKLRWAIQPPLEENVAPFCFR